MFELDPALDYWSASSNQLVFSGPAGGFTIHDKLGLIKAVLDQIKSGLPVGDAFAKLASEEDRKTAQELIMSMLEARRIIRLRQTHDQPDQDTLQAWLRFVGVTKASKPVIGILGQGALPGMVSAELSGLGVEHTAANEIDPDWDLALFCQDQEDTGQLRLANRKCVGAGMTFLPVCVDGHIISVGPLIIPGATACAECAHHRARMNADIVEEMPEGKPAGRSAFTLRLAAMLAVEEALRFVHGAMYELHIAKLMRHSVVTGRRKHSVILKIPRCPVCGPELLRTRPLADTFNRAGERVEEFAE